MSEVKKLLGELAALEGIEGAGIVNKDGRVIDMQLSDMQTLETIAIMTATVFGAANTLCTEARKSAPEEISIKASDCETIIYECSDRALLMVMTSGKHDLAKVKDIAEKVARNFNPD